MSKEKEKFEARIIIPLKTPEQKRTFEKMIVKYPQKINEVALVRK